MYNFHPLAVDSIRLIKIEPELSHGDIACTLSQYDGPVPPYDALSYYWGDPTPTRKIYVNESVVGIHEALWEFLDQMQQSQQTGKWIWTDFLCLNQENIEEMGQQIPRMAQIYSEATATISWLGCSRSSWASRPEGSSTASTNLEEDLTRIREKVSVKRVPVECFFAKPQLLSWTSVTEAVRQITDDASRRDSELHELSSKWRDLPKSVKEVVQLGQGHMTSPILNILSLPYWTRVWIAQEVALAKEVTLMFGSVSLDFQDFFLAYKSYFYFQLKHLSKTPVFPVPIEARAAVNENHVSFPLIVKWGLACDASKPVDRIYGLLGLLAQCASSDESQTLPLTLNGTIDYRRDASELFWDMAFTRPFSTRSFTAGDKAEMEGIEYWVDVLPTLGQVLSCPFTPERLENAVNGSVTPLSRDKAHLALTVVKICRQACISGRTIWIHQAWRDQYCLTKRHARRLFFTQHETLNKAMFAFQRLLGSLVLEASNRPGMDENDEYQAVFIGLRISKLGQLGSMWNCGSHEITSNGNWTAPGHHIDASFDCDIYVASSQLPCSSGTEQDFHRCASQDRYLAIPGAAWNLSLTNLSYESETDKSYWKGTLNVQRAA